MNSKHKDNLTLRILDNRVPLPLVIIFMNQNTDHITIIRNTIHNREVSILLGQHLTLFPVTRIIFIQPHW